MKKFSFMGTLLACSLLAVSCSKNEPSQAPATVNNDGKVRVDFALASDNNFVIAPLSRADLMQSEFEILAFRTDGSDYYFVESVALDNPALDLPNSKLTGSAYFTPGTYKFIGNYGVKSASNISKITWANKAFSKTSYMNVITLGSGGLNELFMTYDNGTANPTQDADYFQSKVTAYDIQAIPGDGTTVEMKLDRAVARVDVQLIHVKNTGTEADPVFEEDIYTNGNVFGGTADNNDLNAVEYSFKNLNPQMTYVGTIPAGNGTFNDTFYQSDMSNTVKIGNGPSTTVAKGSFYQWDNIEQSYIGMGNAHIVGPYLLPIDPDATTKPSLDLTFRHQNGRFVRTIPTIENLPLDRNKVTLVKIYVLGLDIYHTNVKFQVEVDQVWQDPNEVGGIVIN